MNNFLTYINPQVEEIVNDLFDKGYFPDDLTKPLVNKMYWWQNVAYDSAKLNFDSAEMKLVGWISAAEAITGNEESFNTALIMLFTEVIEMQWQIRSVYGQMELNAEHKIKDVA